MNQLTHNEKQIAGFFNQWEIYQHIVEQDYMAHAAITEALSNTISETSDFPLTVLDVGCGDAAMTSQVLASFAIEKYTGVDLSSSALTYAAQNLTSANINYELLEGDLDHYPEASAIGQYNLILAGFSLHHLADSDKQRFYQRCQSALKPGGRLIIWDVLKKDGELREAYLDRYCSMMQSWKKTLPDSAIEQIEEHIRGHDYPQSKMEIGVMAQTAGFEHFQIIYTDVSGFHSLIALS